MAGEYEAMIGESNEDGSVKKMPTLDVLGNQAFGRQDTLHIGRGFFVLMPTGYKEDEVLPVVKKIALSVGVQGVPEEVPDESPVPLVTHEDLEAPIVGVPNPFDDGGNEDE